MNKEGKIKFLKQKLLTVASYFSDIQEYWKQLDYLNEKYDETLEYYNFSEWLEGAGGKRIEIAMSLLAETESIFYDLREESVSELYVIYEEICKLSEEEQMKVWGRKRSLIEKEKFTEGLLDLQEYKDNQSEAMEEFLRILDIMEE